jgi:cytoskeletal protein CcmA (bactofilin family)
VRIDGVFRGRIYSEDTLEIGSDGAVIGELDVAVLVVAGTADGMIRVRERLTLESTGKLLGKVDARWLEIRPGGKIEATVRVG